MLKKIIFIFTVVFLITFSVNAGFAFVTETVTTDNTDSAGAPSIAVDGTCAYAVWQERVSGQTQIYYKRKLLGSSWSNVTKELVSTEQQASANARNPKIAVDGSYVYVTWEDDSNYSGLGTNSKIVYKRKSILGTWPAATEVVSTESSNAANNPQIAIDTTYVYVTWDGATTDSHRDVYYKRKGLGDASWPVSTETVSSDRLPTTEDAYRPVVGVDTNNVYIACHSFFAGRCQPTGAISDAVDQS